MAKLNVEIVTPERRLLETSADEAIIPGTLGLFGVLPGHAALVSTMEPGELTVREAGSVRKFFVAGGFVQVISDKVRVLADRAEEASAIDVNAAKKELADAEARFKALPPGDGKAAHELAAIERARARVQVASHRS